MNINLKYETFPFGYLKQFKSQKVGAEKQEIYEMNIHILEEVCLRSWAIDFGALN